MLPSLILGGALALGQQPLHAPATAPTPIQTAGQKPDVVEGTAAVAIGWPSSIQNPSAKEPYLEPLNLSVTVPAPVAAPIVVEDATSAPATRYAVMTGAQGTWLGAALEQSRMTIFGWTEFSYTPSTTQGTNLPTALNDKAGEFLLNQNYLHVERTIDAAQSIFQWGFVSETILPGSDYRFTLPRGLFNGQLTENNGLPPLYGFDPFQFYGQAFLPDLGPRGTKIILGRFATHCNYEVVQAPDATFLTHTYLFLYNPFTHTGVWGISQLTDDWSMSHGIVTGADTFIDPANKPTYIGQAKWAPPTGRASVTFNTVITDAKYDAKEAFPFYNLYEVIIAYKFSDRSNYAIDAAYSHMSDAPTGGATDWYGTVHYWTYQIRSNVATIVRAEAFKDTSGFRTGFPGWYTDFTAGINWKPNPSLIIRPSVRYDHNWESSPFEGKPDLLTTALDVIVRW